MNLSTARFFVRNLAEARRFYAHALGLPIDAEDLQAGFLVLRAGHCQLLVESVAMAAPREERVLVGRFTGLSFSVPDIHATHAELVGRGVAFTGAPERQLWGGALATLQDPAGNEFQLVRDPNAA